jgi:hypothetical protein
MSLSTLAAKEDSVAPFQKLGPPIAKFQDSHPVSSTSSRAAELGLRLSLYRPVLSEGGAPIYLSVSKS